MAQEPAEDDEPSRDSLNELVVLSVATLGQVLHMVRGP